MHVSCLGMRLVDWLTRVSGVAQREFVQVPRGRNQEFRCKFASTLQSMVCKSNTGMYTFSGMNCRVSLACRRVTSRVTQVGHQRRRQTCWRHACGKIYTGNAQSLRPFPTLQRRYSGTCEPFFVCLHHEDFP